MYLSQIFLPLGPILCVGYFAFVLTETLENPIFAAVRGLISWLMYCVMGEDEGGIQSSSEGLFCLFLQMRWTTTRTRCPTSSSILLLTPCWSSTTLCKDLYIFLSCSSTMSSCSLIIKLNYHFVSLHLSARRRINIWRNNWVITEYIFWF